MSLSDMLSKIIIRSIKKIEWLYWNMQYNQYRKKYYISPSFRFNGNNIILYQDGDIICGNDSYIGENSLIQAINGYKVKIGSNCSVSHYVHIYTSNHYADKNFISDTKMREGDVIIEDYCWIGIKTSIIGPAIIGENSVVGANSVVNRDLPPHSISTGVPAKVIKFKSYLTLTEKLEMAHRFEKVLSRELRKDLSLRDY
jgi:maltose O-acetyltransferase